MVTVTSPYSLSFSWNPPPEETQNGIITAYTLICEPQAELPTFPVTYMTTGTYVITGFSAATAYSCSVYAATVGGNGPPAIENITTPDDGNFIFVSVCLSPCACNCLSLSLNIVPGSVIGLNFTKVSATVLQISWSEPEVTNGVIQSYSIQVDNHIDTVFQESVPGNQKSVLVTNLSKLTYVITTSALCANTVCHT